MAYGIRLGMACIVMAMMLVLLQGAIGAPGFALRENWEFTDEFAFAEQDNGTNGTLANVGCVFSIVPCSYTILGNLILILFYGLVLAAAAKMISDGAELLLDLGLPASIIGGIVLPLLGAVPDSAMIIASGISGTAVEANAQISVGMGTLAGSTIMLLTLPWLGGLILGRVDIVHGEGRDNQVSPFRPKSFFKQGVTVFPDVTYSAIIMLITTLPYFIVQGADWHLGPTNNGTIVVNGTTILNQPPYIRYSALVTCILAFIFFILYLCVQVVYSVSSKRKEQLRKEEALKRRVIKQMYLLGMRRMQPSQTTTVQTAVAEADGADSESAAETKPLLAANIQKRYASAWKMHRAKREEGEDESDAGHEKKVDKTGGGDGGNSGGNVSEEKETEDPKWKIIIKSLFLLVVGVALVTIFSDPMVGVLTAIADINHHSFYTGITSRKFGQYIPIKTFYLSFIITPFCSNASELVSSLMFAAKKKKVNTSLTFSQLYGAATMNNTLCLGIFAALVYFRELDWLYSAEVTVILFVEFTVGILAIVAGFGFRHTYILITGFFVGALYFISIFFVFALENFAHWK